MRAKTGLFGLVTLLVALAGVELGTRVVISVVSGESKLLYGSHSADPEQKHGMLFPDRAHPAKWHVAMQADDREKVFLQHESGPYSKYRSHQYKRNRDEYGHINDIRINNLGFRGADVAIDKPAGVFRVITLGASSTFGYRNRDDETYPVYLQQFLNEALATERSRAPDRCGRLSRVEVVNFGIPHLNTANISSLFAAEGLDLDPDLVTFYEGANETRSIDPGWLQRALSALGDRLLAIRFVHTTLKSYLASFDAGELAERLDGVATQFVGRISTIADACEARGIPLLVTSQQAKSFLLDPSEMARTSYRDEVERVRAKLDLDGRIALKELTFLIHAQLMDELQAWAAGRSARGVEWVDFIGELDAHGKRDQLLSWVHLSAEANRILARQLSRAIIDRVCAPAEAVPAPDV